MSAELALKLVPILDAYFSPGELRDLAALFVVELAALQDEPPRWLAVARELSENLEQGNMRRFIDSLVELAEAKNDDGVAHTSWEPNDFHRSMTPKIHDAQKLLESAGAPSEIAVAAGSVFSAKSKVRELLETTVGDVFVVDPYVGLGTLDCFRGLGYPIRLLTGSHGNSVEAGFDRALTDFIAEGHQIEVRRAQQLHDRHLAFNGRCWLVGGSLKDAGKKPFNCIEITDQKAVVIADLEVKWQAGTPFPP